MKNEQSKGSAYKILCIICFENKNIRRIFMENTAEKYVKK